MAKIHDYEKLGELFHLLIEKYNNGNHKHNRRLKHLTMADIRAIINIGHMRRERMSNLARHLHLTVGTLTNTIDRLVQKGYVQRHRSDEDRRIVEVSLSPKGEDLFKEISTMRKERAEKFFGQLSDEELEVLERILSKLVSNPLNDIP